MKKPLVGITVAVTRARRQSSPFARKLRALGAKVLVCPTIRILPPRSYGALDRALKHILDYHWLVFTSANAVEQFGLRLRRARKPVSSLKRLKTCAIGPITAKAMRDLGLRVDKISREYVAESVLKALPNVRGLRILIPRAEVARDILPKELAQRGAKVDVVTAYRTVADRSAIKPLRRALKAKRLNCVTFTSSSTVSFFFKLLTRKEKNTLIKDVDIFSASIGPVTTRTLKEHAWPPRIVARKPTTDLLARALADFYNNRNTY